MKLLTGLRFKLGFVLIFSFSHYPFSFSVLAPLSPFPFPRSPFLVLRSSFSFPRSPFPVPHSVFSFSRSSFLVSYSLFLVLVKSLRSFRKSECFSHYRVVFLFCFVLLYQHLSVMEDMLKDFMLGEHLLLVGNQVE